MGLATQNFNIYRGDDWSHLISFIQEGGRYITDAQITNGSNQLISAKQALFTEDDKNTMVTVVNGIGIPDGTTIVDVAGDGRSATMSANATATRSKVRVAIRAWDLSGFTPVAQMRATPDAPAVLLDIPIDVTRKGAGLLRFYAGHDVTKLMTDKGVYDLQFTDGDGLVSTIMRGEISVVHDITRIA